MKSYRELEVWQRAVELTVPGYRLTEKFPSAEKFGLVSQIRRAASSVPANIAEGWGRGSTKEYVQFLLVGRGSLMELETHPIVASRLGYLNRQQLDQLQHETQAIGMMLRAPDKTVAAGFSLRGKDAPISRVGRDAAVVCGNGAATGESVLLGALNRLIQALRSRAS